VPLLLPLTQHADRRRLLSVGLAHRRYRRSPNTRSLACSVLAADPSSTLEARAERMIVRPT
jgi:hypothetical protein